MKLIDEYIIWCTLGIVLFALRRDFQFIVNDIWRLASRSLMNLFLTGVILFILLPFTIPFNAGYHLLKIIKFTKNVFSKQRSKQFIVRIKTMLSTKRKV